MYIVHRTCQWQVKWVASQSIHLNSPGLVTGRHHDTLTNNFAKQCNMVNLFATYRALYNHDVNHNDAIEYTCIS